MVIKAMPPYRDVLYSFGFAKKKNMIRSQIADLLAVYSRRYVNKYDDENGYADEPSIISILRDGMYMIDEVAHSFIPVTSFP
jgi:hypothetical protein